MNREFRELCKRCPRLKILLKEQIENGLSKNKWLAVMRLFIDAGRVALAREFSEQSGKHDYESDEIIDALSLQRRDEKVRCLELGCSQNDIEDYSATDAGCFERKEAAFNNKGEIINTPADKMWLTRAEKKKIGFRYNIHKRYFGINPSIYAKHIMDNYILMHHESDRYYIYQGNCWRQFKDFKMGKVLYTFFNKFEPNRWTKQDQAMYMSALPYECWDTDELEPAENYINVKNGLLDLNSEKISLIPHDKMVFSRTQIPIVYDAKAQCQQFEEFLRVTFKGNKNLIRLVQEIMGYCLSNSVKAHKMFIFIGEGSNGKSVLCEIMTALAGGIENVSNVALKDFSHKFSLAQIADKTLNISTENETDAVLDTQLLKAISSGEPIQIEEKFQSPFSYKPYAKLVFAMNKLPYVKDRSYGFERRLVVIPFERRFVAHEPRNRNEVKGDPYLAEKLTSDELGGILAFAIRGLKRLRENNYIFTASKKAEETLEEYKERIDPFLEFVRAQVIACDDKVNMTYLREYFQKWCYREGHDKLSKISAKAFWPELRRVLDSEGISHEKQKDTKDRKQYLYGIQLRKMNIRHPHGGGFYGTVGDADDLSNDM